MPDPCTQTINVRVTEYAEFTVTPSISVGPVTTTCLGSFTIVPSIPEGLFNVCTFVVSQDICVEFGATFDATVGTGATAIFCDGPCTVEAGCVFTRGFYGSAPAGMSLAEALIDANPIFLGLAGEDNLTVTVPDFATASLVFGNEPPLPAPVQPTCPTNTVVQFNQLYAQLLTAQLNERLLDMQGISLAEVCPGAASLIENANILLANAETPCGSAADVIAAELLQAQLNLFNNGSLPGCPIPHCTEPPTIG
ncbi:hypothetical protein QE429_004736 [Bacillus sp. SORGH_AS 510]|uniref:hypothetical protein n=1 Tax=Bacillus sp. SORGH_AS_0510 TaxID=3041771 RepID=UPI00277DE059|nr:hypothetical protein [Bacillus sp. SORGH_AS_0510]MDQ1147909.1 hypothetical protein [Bacillus sp. SORGH_AS_0510]